MCMFICWSVCFSSVHNSNALLSLYGKYELSLLLNKLINNYHRLIIVIDIEKYNYNDFFTINLIIHNFLLCIFICNALC